MELFKLSVSRADQILTSRAADYVIVDDPEAYDSAPVAV